jgi:hypothetical protein
MLIKPLVFLVVIAAWIDLTPYPAYGAADGTPCSANSESRQLDFWLGNWRVTYPGAPGSSSSRVYTELDQCLLIESWDGGKGHRGENMFAYSADDKGWRGMFADNQGRVHALEGKAAAGSAEFFGPSRDANGKAVLNRIRIVRVSADTVEQSWEKSADNGATWTMEFRGQYSRKNP